MSEIDIGAAADVEFLSVARWRAGSEWHPRPHAHPFCEVIVVTQGRERARVAGKELVCDAGHVLVYPPGCRHEEWQLGTTRLEFYCVEFTWPRCPEQMPHLVHDRQGRILELARWLDSESVARYPGDGAYRRMVTRMLAAELLRLTMSPPKKVVEQVCGFVHEHLSEPLALDDLAGACGLNKFHLLRSFRSLTGLTPMEYVRMARLDTARRLLLATDLPLKEIAPRVGFANEYHLSRLLKARYGRGARDLRRQTHRTEAKSGETAER